MTEQHDPVEDWLERDVRPLMPPAGTLERIRLRARRRRRNQALMAAAACAVVVAGAVSAPQIASALHSAPAGHVHPPAAAGRTSLPATPSGRGSLTPQSATATPEPQHSTLTPGQPANDPVPPGFEPTSVTFAGTGTGGVVGAVIGQAVGGKCATRYCTSLAQTPDYGKTWFGLAAPVTGPPPASSGVSQVRFLNLSTGWAFGPGLWATTSGGWPWHREDTHGLRVIDLEAAGQRAFAVFASCAGASADYAGDCTAFSLWSSAAGSSRWQQVTVPYPYLPMRSSAPSSASLVISGGTTAYLLTPSGEVVSGPVAGGSWSAQGKAPCAPGPPQADGAPSDAQLAAGKSLLLACDGGQQTSIYSSPDGRSWKKLAVLPVSCQVTSLAANSTGQVALASTRGLYYSGGAGTQWQAATVTGSPAAGFSYVGMTNATQGVALPADASLGEIFVTSDGGRTWSASPVRSA